MEPSEYFGYKGSTNLQHINIIELLQKYEPCCLIKKVDFESLQALKENKFDASIGQWVVSTGSCQTSLKFYGPFNEMMEAFEAARVECGAIRIVSPFTTGG